MAARNTEFAFALQYQGQADQAAMLTLAIHLRRRRRPDNRRLQYGQYKTLMQELQDEDVSSFKGYLRITPTMFDDILQRHAPRIKKRDTRFHIIQAGLKLALTLRYMATGDCYASLAFDFRVGQQSVCNFVLEVCTTLLD